MNFVTFGCISSFQKSPAIYYSKVTKQHAENTDKLQTLQFLKFNYCYFLRLIILVLHKYTIVFIKLYF